MAYDFTNFLHVIGTLNRVAEKESNSQGIRFNKSHKKQMSIWNKLHKKIVEEGDVLSQYDSISIDNKIIESLDIGLEDA